MASSNPNPEAAPVTRPDLFSFLITWLIANEMLIFHVRNFNKISKICKFVCQFSISGGDFCPVQNAIFVSIEEGRKDMFHKHIPKPLAGISWQLTWQIV